MPSSPYSSQHKPRRKAKAPNGVFATTFKPSDASTSVLRAHHPPFPLAHYLWATRAGTTQWIVVPLLLMIVFLYRWATGFWEYSGYKAPPMHGDFEAQRHWMEITTHLPISQWYFHDLEWWGLDYPPLTAYHSWFLGKVGSYIDPSWFALRTSRGLDDPRLKIFMRATVVVSEYLTYIPAVIMFVRRFAKGEHVSRWEANLALTAILMQPATILIDHAHFQYNTVMLGAVAASAAALLSGAHARACVYFVAALGFKQMALYYAPAMFAFLLGSCAVPKINIGRFFTIAIWTAISFAVVVVPLVFGAIYDSEIKGKQAKALPTPALLDSLHLSPDTPGFPILLQLAQMIHRVFPFARGLFEDKVANFWCALHTFHKLHIYSKEMLQKLSLGLTILSILPPCLAIGIHPQPKLLPQALATTAWGFFLFSFQVHEKSVLLPLLPMTLLLSGDGGLLPETRSWITWANILGSWTMYPLLKRDGLKTPYFVLTLFWAYMMGVHTLLFPSKRDQPAASIWSRLIQGAFYVAMIAWHFLEVFAPPIAGKPDLWVVVNVLIGAPGFGLCYLWCLWRLVSGVLAEQAAARRRREKGKEKAL